MTAKPTASQTKALTLIAENPGRVVAWQRAKVDNYLKINGNVECALARTGYARTVVAGTRTDSYGNTYDLAVWEITDAGRAALAA
jgi:hypothetical protein